MLKEVNDYSDSDALALLTNQNFYIDKVDSEFYVVNALNDQMEIGGAGKIDLYRSHLVTLHNIIKKIESEKDVSNLLVALATGSGKTYVQALWMLILSLSGNSGVFAVPDKLVSQLHKDLSRLLPDSFVNEMLILRNNQECPEAEAAIEKLSTETTAPKIILSSSERLLDRHYQQLLAADSQHTFLSFDEQHLLMKSEARRVRLIELSKQKLTMYLTATPNKET